MVDFEEYLDTVGNKTNGTDALSFDTIVSAFRCFDSNGDGVVDAAELRHCMATLGVKMADDEIDDMIELADVNCDGKINYNGQLPLQQPQLLCVKEILCEDTR